VLADRALRVPGTLAERMRELPFAAAPLRVRAYVIGVCLATGGGTAAAAIRTSWHPADLALLAALLACGAASVEATRTAAEPQGTLVRDMLTTWYLAVAVLLPPVYVFAAPVPLVALKQWRVQRGIVYRRVFSAAATGLSYGAASIAYHSLPAVFAGVRPGAPAHAASWLVAVAACGAAGWAANILFILAAIHLSDPGASLRQLAWSREAATTDVVEVGVGILVTLAIAVSALSLLLALPVVLLERRFVMHTQLVSASRIDAKTGLLNAAAWHGEGRAELSRAARTRASLAVAMIDIDHFKAVNDTYGHQAGDAVLATVAAEMRDSLRGYDVPGRFGGEEFAVLLPGTTGEEACLIAERLRERLAAATTLVGESTPVQITVSIGVTALRSASADLDELISAADIALYRAKNAGRNQTCWQAPSAEDDGAGAYGQITS
jgi:diguanylate cyclase (GGDEF)-like protein